MADGGEAAPLVTATRGSGRHAVEVHLDGRRWRVVPVGAAAAAGLTIGVSLDRARARALNQALRRERALARARRFVRHADHTEATLSSRLARASVGGHDRVEAVRALVDAGVVDDMRYARARAETLALRDWGDEAIRCELVGRGIAPATIDEAVGRLEPEADRLAAVLARDGRSPRVIRRLAGRGFDATVLGDGALDWEGDDGAVGAD